MQDHRSHTLGRSPIAAYPLFSLGDALLESVAIERRSGHLDLGPTDALSEEERELAYDRFFGTSPLHSATPSPPRSRSASPTRTFRQPDSPEPCPPPFPESFDSTTANASTQDSDGQIKGSSKDRYNKRKSKARRLAKRQKENDKEKNAPARPSTIRKYVKPAEKIKSDYKVADFPSASTGYVALPDNCHQVVSLQDLIEKHGFTLVENRCKDQNPRPIVDHGGLVIAVIVGEPSAPDWESVIQTAYEELEVAAKRCEPPKKSGKKCKRDRHGKFVALNAGISHGGGTTMPGNIYHSHKNRKVVEKLIKSQAFNRIAGFSSSAFATWSPKLHNYYKENLDLLTTTYPNLRRNYRNSVWAAAAFNLPPRTVTAKHRDFGNLPFGLCGITALGDYDPIRGGHIALWELKLVIEFPPGCTILLPSASISHSNTPIGPHETRASFTQFSSGGLFRWAEQGFQTAEDFDDSLTQAQKEQVARENQARCKLGLSLLSTLDDLRAAIV